MGMFLNECTSDAMNICYVIYMYVVVLYPLRNKIP